MADTAVSIALKMQDQASAPIKRAMNQIDRSASTARKSTTKLADSIGAVYKHLAALGIMVGIGALARGFTRMADNLTLVEGRLSLVTSSSKELVQVQNELFQIANQTRVAYQGTADLYTRMARSTKELDVSQKDLLQTTKTINQALIVSGASATEANAALIQLSQGLASGALRGDELRSVLEQTPRLARAMAEGLGVGIGQLRELGTAGELTAEKVISSLLSQKDVIEREFSRMPVTVGQAMTILNNEIGRFVSAGDDATSLTSNLAEGIRDFANAIHEIDTKIFADVADLISALWDVMTALPEGFIDFFTRAEDKIEDATKAVDAQRTSYENLVNYMSWLGETMLAALTFMLKETGNFLGFMLVGIIEFVKGAGRWLKTWSDLAVAAFSFDKEGIKKAWGEIWGGVLDETIKGMDANAKAFEAGAKEAWEDYLKVYGRIPDLIEPIIDKFEKAGEFAGKFAADIRAAGESVQVSVSKMGDRIDKVFNAALSKLVKLMDESKAAMDRIVLAALPEYERGLEQIERRYKELNAALDEWGTLAGKTMPEIAQLHTDLGHRMDEEIHDYVKSHETGTDTIYDTWSHMYERLQDVTADWIYDMKVDFDSLLDLFKRTVAEMISAWIWGQQSMQFATSSQGGFSLGNMFGGMFGGGGVYGSGDPRSSNFVGPLQQGMQGAQSAYSLYGAYGAYQGAGGGWAGAKAGAGSFFGGGTGSGGSGFAGMGAMGYASWIAAIVYAAAQIFGTYNAKHGYGKIDGTPQGYDSWQPQNPLVSGNYFSNDWANDPARNFMRGKLGYKNPAQSDWFSYHMGEGNYWDAFLASGPAMAEWMDPIGSFIMNDLLGFDPGKFLGYSNKKRSYYGKAFGFSEYSMDEGWGDSWGQQYRDKRDGGEAFGEAGESMAQTAQNLMNAMDSLFKNMLGSFGETWENKFVTEMVNLAAQTVPTTNQSLLDRGITEVPRMSFEYYISAEDEDEFKEDWRKSWQKMTENIIDPIVEVGSDLLSQALDGAVTDAVAWNYFTDEMREYLRTSLEDSLGNLKVDWSVVTDQESFEAALEQMGLAAQQIAEIVGYFDAVSDILSDITESIELHEFSESARAAIRDLRGINAQFDEYAAALESMGVDLEKYTDLEKARHLAISDAIEAMMLANISSEDLTLAIQYMADEMTAAGHSLEEIAGAVSAAWIAAADAASTHIADSYSAAIDQIKTSMMSDQELYNYYSSQVAQLEQLLPTLSDPAAIQQTMDDILRYTMSAYDMLSPEQQQIYGPQFIQGLQENQEAANNFLERYRDSFKSNEERLTDLIEKTIRALLGAAGIQKVAANTQLEAGRLQLAASHTPVQVGFNLLSSDVG